MLKVNDTVHLHQSSIKALPEDHKVQALAKNGCGVIRMINIQGYHIDFLGGQDVDLVKVQHRDINHD